MKVKCKISHEEPLGDGKFKHYIAGEIYDKEVFEEALFEPIRKDNKAVVKNIEEVE